MGKILSIAVPAYNVQEYLEKNLQSMLIPEIMPDIEVLIINDGSSDNTAYIARKYCEQYPDTFKVYTKENGGHGSGINYGIRYASGKYFKVVDGDDWLNTEKLPELLSVLKERNEDIIASDYLCVEDGTERVIEQKKCVVSDRQYGKTYRFDDGNIEQVIKMHAFTIKTEILKNNNISIDEKCYYVDCEYIIYPIPYAEDVYFYPEAIYMYRLGRAGQSVAIESMQKNRAQHQKVLHALLDFYDSMPQISQNKRRYIVSAIGQVVENQFQIYISMGNQKGIRKELMHWDQELKRDYYEIYKATRKTSITLLRCTNYKILKIAAAVYRLIKGK